MNCKEANEILITDFLHSLGIEPKKVTGNNYWYLSPLRDEKSPSFKVDVEINRWYDHGIGTGGKLVDLGIKILEVDVEEFLKQVREKGLSNSLSFQKPNISAEKLQQAERKKTTIKKIKEIENKALTTYLNNRMIDLGAAQLFCQEIYFSIETRNYFGLGFKNDFGGFEIRNRYFKGCIGPKGITTIERNRSKVFVLFEGFFDFLSMYQFGGTITDCAFIILNSTNQIHNAITELTKKNPETILAYFDNDDAGKKCLQHLQSAFPNAIDQSKYYADFKDVNEMIIKTKF